LAFSNMPTLWGTRSKLTLPVLDFCFLYYLKIRLSLNISSVNISPRKFFSPVPAIKKDRSRKNQLLKWDKKEQKPKAGPIQELSEKAASR